MLSQNSPKFKPGDLIYWRNPVDNSIIIAEIISIKDLCYCYQIIHPFKEVLRYANCYYFEKEPIKPFLVTKEIKLEIL